MAAQHATFHELVVDEVERLTDESVAITFALPPALAADYVFAMGQHLTIRWGEGRKSFSIASPAGGPLRIGVKHIPDGEFSSYALEKLQPGDSLEVMTPAGRFSTPVDPANERHVVLIAAGSGITPILGIAATLLEQEPRSRVTLLYGNRTTRTVMFLEDVEDLKNLHPGRFHLIHVLSREQQEVELFHGRLDPERLGRILDALVPVDTADDWFLCGPFQMVTEGRELLLARGADPHHVHLELFHTGEVVYKERAATTTGATVSATLDGRATELDVAAEESILDVMLRVRSDAPYACKGGVCGTCRARLVRGTVDMAANFALEPDELERGYVLTCQAFPTSGDVAVDYDG